MLIRKIISSFHAGKGLQLRMTLWVVGTALAVSAIVMIIASIMLRRQYEEEVRSQLVSSIDNTVIILDQRMKRMEYITHTAASLLGNHLNGYNDKELESAVYGLLNDVECIDVVSLTLANGNDGDATAFAAYCLINDDKRSLVAIPPYREDLSNDPNWIESYQHGRGYWYTHFTPKGNDGEGLQCYSFPVYTPDSVCRGMLCTMLFEKHITNIVKDYNTNPDINVTIYNPSGTCIAGSGNQETGMSSDKMLTEHRIIDRLKWKMVFSVNSDVITDRLNGVVLRMALSIIILLLSLVVSIMLAIRYVARPYVEHQSHIAEAKASMERELKIASETQQQLVPHRFPPFPDRSEVSLHACLHPAREVGGDLYDYFIDQDMLYFCIGDVSGKGAPASLFMAATHYLFRSVASIMPISDAMKQINRSLAIDNDNCNFVTFFFAGLDLTTGMLEYTNAGHNAPILIHNGETSFFAESDSTPLGIWDEEEYPTHTMQMNSNDTLLLYTDGVTEAMNPRGEELGNDSLLRCVTDSSREETETIIGNVLECVSRHADTALQSDDITMLCVRFNQNSNKTGNINNHGN